MCIGFVLIDKGRLKNRFGFSDDLCLNRKLVYSMTSSVVVLR
ncbi:hypothetical protein HMPREF1051_1824 [Neisseria sicca VK64]|uniref:Uncharacterized protein n=1 Tax=Neisseria sicca VK64 TaxID=1095748 RepID=I2NU83_NEISI|nr:hypothetical protein HMPREF1051_1824 [Neisseria sicca VK64]